ncbi:hypothetical protein ScPMuIL_013607 [Solemya velum]
MALVERLQSVKNETAVTDITQNLPTLQFESALDGSEKDHLPLRIRSHAISVSACAQATFFTSILNKARQKKNELKSPVKKSSRFLQDLQQRDSLKVGIIGCGRLGSQLADCLLTYGGIPAHDLAVSTRRPETLENLKNRDVDCYHDNKELASSSHVIFICVLPSQFPVIAEEIKSEIRAEAFVYSLMSSYSIKKLCQLLKTTNILRPEISWDSNTVPPAWEYSVSVSQALENKQTVLRTCPFYEDHEDCVVLTKEKLMESMVFCLINFCSEAMLTRKETLTIVNSTLFEDCQDELRESDFIKKLDPKSWTFPKYDLVKIADLSTPVIGRLMKQRLLRNYLQKKYCFLFENYLQLKAYGQIS